MSGHFLVKRRGWPAKRRNNTDEAWFLQASAARGLSNKNERATQLANLQKRQKEVAPCCVVVVASRAVPSSCAVTGAVGGVKLLSTPPATSSVPASTGSAKTSVAELPLRVGFCCGTRLFSVPSIGNTKTLFGVTLLGSGARLNVISARTNGESICAVGCCAPCRGVMSNGMPVGAP